MGIEEMLEEAQAEIADGNLQAAELFLDEVTQHQLSSKQRTLVALLRSNLRVRPGGDWSARLAKNAF